MPRIKRGLLFGFLLIGFSFAVTQGPLIRELLVAFFGNELSIGLVLGNWLILEAVGSGLLGKLANRWRGKRSSLATLQVLFALFLPLCLCAAYTSRSLVGSILVSVVLIPVLGILETCLLVAILKLSSLLLVVTLTPRS